MGRKDGCDKTMDRRTQADGTRKDVPQRPRLWIKLAWIVLSLVSVAVTTAVLAVARPWLSTPVIALLFLLPVMLAATRWGLQPALAASLLAFFAFNYFFLAPRHTLVVDNPREFLALLVFLIVAVLISQLVGTANEHAAQARARELESAKLYRLSSVMSAQAELDEILSSVTRHVAEVFDLAGCEILLGAADGTMRSHARYWPADSALPSGAPVGQVIELPLTANQTTIGVLRLTTRDPQAGLEPATTRILTTFVTQIGLVIERARLAREATRARLLEESDRLKSALLSSVSHDLRTPLAAIKAAATVLLQQDVGLDDTARHDLLSTIDEEVDQLNWLVRDLLDMSRIEAGALTLKLDWCGLDELIRAVAHRLASRMAHLTLQMDWPDDLPLVYADSVLIDRVVTNLLENACRFAPPASTVRVAIRSDDAGATVSVCNEGPMIPPAARAHLFEKFYRFLEGPAASAGTGLGLSICKGIVEAHGGEILVTSPVVQDRGVCFAFTLPLPPGVTRLTLPVETDENDEQNQGIDR